VAWSFSFDRETQPLRRPENCRWPSLELTGDGVKLVCFRKRDQFAVGLHRPVAVYKFLGHDVTPAHSTASEGCGQWLRASSLQSGQASSFRPIPGAMRMRRKSEGNRRGNRSKYSCAGLRAALRSRVSWMKGSRGTSGERLHNPRRGGMRGALPLHQPYGRWSREQPRRRSATVSQADVRSASEAEPSIKTECRLHLTVPSMRPPVAPPAGFPEVPTVCDPMGAPPALRAQNCIKRDLYFSERYRATKPYPRAP
jgi:hypothetical protein